MSSEFINDSDDEVVKGIDDNQNQDLFTNMLIVVIVVLLIAVIMNTYGADCAAYFQGAFPDRSDVGVDKFDLQKEITYLSEKQMNNLGYV
jgi:hypothetical protein